MTQLREIQPKRVQTLIAICRNCDGSPRELRRAIKVECKRGTGKSIRVVTTSCLDLCPKRAVAVAIIDRRAARPLRYLVVSDVRRAADVVALARE